MKLRLLHYMYETYMYETDEIKTFNELRAKIPRKSQALCEVGAQFEAAKEEMRHVRSAMLALLENCQHQHNMTGAFDNAAIKDPEEEDEMSLTFPSLPRRYLGKPLYSRT